MFSDFEANPLSRTTIIVISIIIGIKIISVNPNASTSNGGEEMMIVHENETTTTTSVNSASISPDDTTFASSSLIMIDDQQSTLKWEKKQMGKKRGNEHAHKHRHKERFTETTTSGITVTTAMLLNDATITSHEESDKSSKNNLEQNLTIGAIVAAVAIIPLAEWLAFRLYDRWQRDGESFFLRKPFMNKWKSPYNESSSSMMMNRNDKNNLDNSHVIGSEQRSTTNKFNQHDKNYKLISLLILGFLSLLLLAFYLIQRQLLRKDFTQVSEPVEDEDDDDDDDDYDMGTPFNFGQLPTAKNRRKNWTKNAKKMGGGKRRPRRMRRRKRLNRMVMTEEQQLGGADWRTATGVWPATTNHIGTSGTLGGGSKLKSRKICRQRAAKRWDPLGKASRGGLGPLPGRGKPVMEILPDTPTPEVPIRLTNHMLRILERDEAKNSLEDKSD